MLITFGKVWLLLFAAGSGLNERGHCLRLAQKYQAEVEVVLWDRSRCDMVTQQYAIEVDWAPKWAEAVGQATYYAVLLHREPAIILLVRDRDREFRHLLRAQVVCATLGIRLFVEEIDAE